MSKTRKSRRHLRMESLEDRILMAGDVLVTAVTTPLGPTLDIVGDNLSNDIAIWESGGLVHVAGLPAGGSPTTINGAPATAAFSAIGYNFHIDMQGGKDRVSMDNVNAQDLNVHLGSGRDAIGITNTQVMGSTGLRGGPHRDTLHIADSTVFNNALIAGGRDPDRITLERNVFTGGTLTVKGGPGRDAIFSEYNSYSYLDINSGSEADIVSLYQDEVANLLQIRTGAGDDSVVLDRIHVNGPTSLQTGGGDDGVEVTNSDFFGPFNADGGLGVDEFYGLDPAMFNNNFFGGSAQINFAVVN